MSEIITNKLTGKTAAGDVTITDGSVTMKLQDGVAKARIHADQATTVNDSFNMSATTDHGTGNYTFSITNNFSDQYWQLAHEAGTEGTTFGLYLKDLTTGRSSGAHRFQTMSVGNANQDASEIQQVCFGDLA